MYPKLLYMRCSLQGQLNEAILGANMVFTKKYGISIENKFLSMLPERLEIKMLSVLAIGTATTIAKRTTSQKADFEKDPTNIFQAMRTSKIMEFQVPAKMGAVAYMKKKIANVSSSFWASSATTPDPSRVSNEEMEAICKRVYMKRCFRQVSNL